MLRIQNFQISTRSIPDRCGLTRVIVSACFLFIISSDKLAFADQKQLNKQPGQQQDPQLVKQRHKLLQVKIHALNKQLQKQREQHETELHQLNMLEKRLANLLRQLARNSAKQQHQQQRLVKLRRKYKTANQTLSRQIGDLGQEARLAFLQGRQSSLKILLANYSSAVTQRGLVSHRYILRYRRKRIEAINRQLSMLSRLQLKINKRVISLSELNKSYEQKKKLILSRRSERRLLVKRLVANLKNDSQRLQAYEKSRAELGAVLKVITKTLENLPVTRVVFKTFPSLKGGLNWPVQGKIVSHFKQRTAKKSLHYRGVFIGASIGTKVKAISHGRVAYADWLRGFGLIIVIEHGNKYMTLYGHNQALYKQVGDWVQAGEIIAATGESGGLGHSGLYFEIRREGIPLNPAKWCRKVANNR